MSNRAQTTYKFDSPSSTGLDIVPIGALVTQVSPPAVYECLNLIAAGQSVLQALNSGLLTTVSSGSSGTANYMSMGGYIFQWGSGTYNNGTTSVTLPTTYPTAIYAAYVSISDTSTNLYYAFKATTINLSTINIINNNSGAGTAFWFTIGK